MLKKSFFIVILFINFFTVALSAQLNGLVFDKYEILVIGSELNFECSNSKNKLFPNLSGGLDIGF